MDQDEKDTSTEASKPKDRIEKVILPNGNEVIVAGIAKHTTSLGEVKNVMDSLEECVKSKGKENVVFLGEGSAVTAGVSKESVEIAIFGGDQQAMARKAKELEVSAVDTWDMSFEEQIGSAKELYGAENALLWMLSQSSIHLRDQGKQVNIENVLSMLDQFGVSKDKIASSLGDPNVVQALENNEAGNRFLQEQTGFTLEEVNADQEKYKQLSQVAYPFNSEEDLSRLPEGLKEAGKVAGGLSQERDKYFAKKVDQYSQQGKTVFVSCGGAHTDNFLDILHKNENKNMDTETKEKLEKPAVFYHASQNRDISELSPRAESVRSAEEGPVVFGARDKESSTMFMVPTNDSWTMKSNFNGTYVEVISDRKRFEEADKGGAIYHLPPESFENDPTKGMKGNEWTSKTAVKPTNVEYYDSGLQAMLDSGVQVYFVDQETFQRYKDMEKKEEIIEDLKKRQSENQVRNVGVRQFA